MTEPDKRTIGERYSWTRPAAGIVVGLLFAGLLAWTWVRINVETSIEQLLAFLQATAPALVGTGGIAGVVSAIILVFRKPAQQALDRWSYNRFGASPYTDTDHDPRY